MEKSLVIVESPAKAKTINKYLGSDYVVRSCIGHIRDLPKGGKGKKTTLALPEVPPKGKKYAKLIRSMGVNPYKNWEARYEILPGKEKVIKELQGLAKTSKDIYLATDLDREGEAIAWNLAYLLGKDKKYRRVTFTEITKDAIKKSFDKPEKINDDKVQAQQARRFLDRVVGYMLSPLLWKKVARGLSAGRVQSVAVKLITEREREIRKFIPEEFWTMEVEVSTPRKDNFIMEVLKYNKKAFKPTSQKESDKALADLKTAEIVVQDVKESTQKSSPPPPFITSTLQQAASTRLGFSVKRTMIAAQKLYEAGYITYMRTDSFNLSSSSLEQCRAHISKEYGAKYLPENTRYYRSSAKKAQEAHEAIRPSNVNLPAEGLPGTIGASERRLYHLIWARFLACQMTDAIYRRLKITALADKYELQAAGRALEFDGFLKVVPPSTNDKIDLPADLKENELLKAKKFIPEQHFTKPPPRYTEASLVKEMEKLEIGRPSTYAPIISTIQDRGYVRLTNKKFYAEKVAEIVIDRLSNSFPDLLGYDFTASMEDTLDSIANGNKVWTNVLDDFYASFVKKLEKAEDEKGGMKPNTPVATKIKCPTCSRDMVIRTAASGIFLGCSGYDDKKEPCKKTINIVSTTQVTDVENEKEDAGLDTPPAPRKKCPKCDSFMSNYIVDAKQKLHICENSPDCTGVEIEKGDFSAQVPESEELECDKCGGIMEMQSGRFGKYFTCSNEECDNKRRVLSNGQVAPPRMSPVQTTIACTKYPQSAYMIREGAMGLFLAAPGFPKQRETRSPYVKELVPYKDQLDKKFHYLLGGPTEDKDGNLLQIRYSRKKGENYLMSVNEKNRPLQKVFYENKRWEVA